MKNTMTAKKKVFAVIAAFTLAAAGTAATIAMTGKTVKPITAAAAQAATKIKAGTYGGGQVAMVKGSECEFNGMNAFNVNLEKGKEVTFRAYADEGYTFLYWYDDISGENVSSQEDITVNADKDLDLYAVFDVEGESFEIKASVYGEGYIEGTNDGTEPEIDPEFPMTSVTLNTTEEQGAVLIAQAKDGYEFRYWYDEETEEIYSTDARIEINADKDLSLAAFFDIAGEAVKVEAVTEGEGMIEGDTNDYEPEVDADFPLNKVFLNVVKGQEAVFIAQAKDGYKFVNWINSETREVLSTEERFVITPDTALSLTAVFEKA
ncbi:MAG: InlB B-repeat-containing protein [Ruminococcus sp.]|nr:InlB B-repeat-containing protein [Ruminococcus sp.]